MSTNPPAKYKLFNFEQSKKLVIILTFEGLDDIISSVPVNTYIRYGDPNTSYGNPGLVYGGLRPYITPTGGSALALLSPNQSSSSVTQRIEPEQGKGSIGQLTFNMIDKNQYMTRLVSPGIVLPEFLGVQTNVYIGYQDISYPEDYFRIFRGVVATIDYLTGSYNIGLSDPTIKKKTSIFYIPSPVLTEDIAADSDFIDFISTGDFFAKIQGPDGSYDPAIRTYVVVDDEVIDYTDADIYPTFLNPILPGRGARGTTPAPHAIGTIAATAIQIQDYPMIMALKLMLSGWNGPWITGVPILSLVQVPDFTIGDIPNVIVLPLGKDAIEDYGLTIGDWVTISDALNPSNNGNYEIIRIDSFDQSPNRLIYINGTLIKEFDSPATLSFRSQFDTYPVEAGLKMTPQDVDVATHLYIHNTFFSVVGTQYQFYITEVEEDAKSFIESEIYLPIGAYSITNRGRCSVGYTHPPIADPYLVFLDETNVLAPAQLTTQRSINNRKFFNEIDFYYDVNDQGDFQTVYSVVDTNSLNNVGIGMNLPIESKGLKTALLGNQKILTNRANFLLSRYKNAALQITTKVNWQAGSLIETGDVIALNDKGFLQIPNYATGTRDLGLQLYEVIDRKLNFMQGNVDLTLLNGIGGEATDRYATISPSSVIVSGTTSYIIIEDSFGAIFPGSESTKWEQYVGQNVYIHSPDFSVGGVVQLQNIDPTNSYKLNLTPALGFTPQPGYILDIDFYPNTADKSIDALYKVIHCFLDAQVLVATGISTTQFTVAPGDIGKFVDGCYVRIHNFDYSVDSGDALVASVDTGTFTITLDVPIGFTPATGQQIELNAFPDAGFAYRWI